MKIRIPFFLISIIVLSTDLVHGQGMLNKLKNKANQEVNKLENGSTSSSQTQSPPNKNKLSANVTRTVVVKLGGDESFDYNENCIDLGANIATISFIVNKRGGQCYSYQNGSKTPVTCPTVMNNNCQTALQCSYYQLREISPSDGAAKKYITNQTESHNAQQPSMSDQQMKAMAAYMTPTQLEELKKQMAEAQKQTAGQTYSTITSSTINFGGKSYGPYKQLSKFYLTPDNNNFYALVGETKADNPYLFKYKMITSVSNATLSLPDNTAVMSCIASPDNSEFGYMYYDLAGQKYVVTTSSGKKTEVGLQGGGGVVWYSTTGNHIIFLSQNQLFVDGQVVRTFAPNEYSDPCGVYVTSDGKGASIIKNNIMSFADGDHFEYPLKITIVSVSGKMYYKWLAFETNEVVVYQKPY